MFNDASEGIEYDYREVKTERIVTDHFRMEEVAKLPALPVKEEQQTQLMDEKTREIMESQLVQQEEYIPQQPSTLISYIRETVAVVEPTPDAQLQKEYSKP